MLLKKKPVITTMKLVGYSLSILLAIITILSGYGGMVNPDSSALPAILAMTFPIWLVISVIVFIIDLFIYKHLALIQGASLVVCIGPILSFCPLNISRHKLTEPEQERSFSVMSYNVYGLHDFMAKDLKSTYDTLPLTRERDHGISNPTLSWILHQDKDIVCLQEFEFFIKRSGKHFLTRELYDSVCRQYPYRVVANKCGILSKFPIYPVELQQDEEYTCQHLGAIAEIQGHRTLVMSIHLQSIGLDNSDKELYREITEGEGGKKKLKEAKTQLLSKLSRAFRIRARQARMIRHQIDSLGVENVILCGDYNDIQDCYAMRVLAGDDFKSAFTSAGFGPVITYHANRFYFHIDHILYRGELEALNFKKYDFPRSDHYPISSRFLWIEDARKVNRNHKGIDLINRE